MSAWVSLPQDCMVYDNLKQTDVYNSGAKVRRSVIVRRTKYQSFETACMLAAVIFFYTVDFVGRIGIMLLNFTPFRSPDIFFNHPSRSQTGKISRWNKHTDHQANLENQCSGCSLPANK